MTRGTAKRLLTACLTLGAAAALAATAEAQDTSQTGATPMPQDTAPTAQAGGDTLGGDSTKWGYPVDTTAPQNPPGYRGMERPVDSTAADSSSVDSAAAKAPGDTTEAERDGTADTTATRAASDTSAPRDTILLGEQQPDEPSQPEPRIEGDSAQSESP